VLKPGSIALTIVLALLTAIGPLSTDMYLPSLPQIVRDFGASIAEVQLTLSVFLVGFAAGMLVYGPLADRYGRRPVLIAGLAVLLVGTVACALAPSIEALIAGRFVQALGGAGPVILARSIVRDLYEGPRAGQELARMGAIMGVVPAVAPTIGGLLDGIGGWRTSFVFTVAFGGVLALVALTRLPETRPADPNATLSARGILADFRTILGAGSFRANTAILCAVYAGLFSYISGSSFVLQDHYALGRIGYGLAFGAGALAFTAGSLAGQRIVMRLGLSRVMGLGTAMNAAGGVLMLAAVFLGPGHPTEIFVPMMVYLGGLGLALPQATAAAIMPFPERAGSASSLMGFLQMVAGAVTGIAVGHAVDVAWWSLPVFIAALGIASFVLWATTRRVREALPVRPSKSI
jgi:DHA1 family bicyclomycin/chloramphenicol resistance-like MFS transporter